MKLVIDIPEEIVNEKIGFSFDQVDFIIHSVLNGVPLEEKTNTAEWISCDEDDLKISDYRCSNCGKYQDDMTNFCPNCGSRMKGVGE